MRRRLFILILFTLYLVGELVEPSLITSLSAQMQRLYTTQRGLATSDIRGIDIDSRGLAWISGVASLQVFDGYSFYDISLYNEDLGRNICSVVNGIMELDKDHFLVYTSNGLYTYNLSTNQFQIIHLDSGEDPSNGYLVTDIQKSGDKLLVFSGGYSLFVLDPNTLKIDSIAAQELKMVLNDAFYCCTFIDSKGNLWSNGYRKILHHTDLTAIRELEYTMDDDAKSVLDRCNINSMCETDDGLMLFGTNMGILCFRESADGYGGHLSVLDCASVLGAPVVAMQKMDDGSVMVGTDSRGLWILRKDGEKMSCVKYDLGHNLLNLDYAKVKRIYKDKNGNLLIGLLQKGLLIIPPHSDRFRYHAITPRLDGANASCVTSMAVDKDMNYWIGTDGCGVFRTDGLHLATAKPINTGLNSLLIQTLAVDKRQSVWVGSYGGGVQCCTKGESQFTTPSWLSQLSSELIMTLAYDNDKDLLYIGTNGKGLFVADLAKQTLSLIDNEIIHNTWIAALCLTKDGMLWIGNASGLIHLYTSTGKHGELPYRGSHTCTIQQIAEIDENILIATSNGLVIHNPKTNTQKYLLDGEHIMAIEQTKDCYWLSTDKSIVCIDKVSFEVTRYTSFGGFYMGEFHKASFVHPVEDDILFGGDNGIICFTPSKVREPSKISHELLLSKIRIGDTEQSLYDGSDLILNHDQNSFIINFSLPDFSQPGSIHYEYKLEGYDSQWQTCQGQPQAYYSSVPAGNYKFIVKAYYESDSENAVEKSISLTINHPWYDTLLAWCLYIIIIGVVAYFFIKAYIFRRRQHQLLMKARESEQRKEEKLRLFTSIIHELRSPVTMIVSPLKQLMSSTQDEGVLSLYQVMKRNCDRLLDIVKQVTDIRTIDSGQLKLKLEEVEFVEYLDNICASFTAMATVRNITFTIEYSQKTILTWIDPNNFEKIVTNLLSNAFKFTPDGGVIKVRVNGSEQTGNGSLELRVYNSGEHIAEDDLPHLFERFYQGSAPQVLEADTRIGSGIGLNLVYELVQLHQGTVRCTNIDPQGVEFIVSIPIANALLAPNSSLLTSEGSKRTILIVDDDAELCSYVSSQLTKDFNVLIAYSGNKAWEYVLKYRPDVVVTDIRMPDGNGIELCQRIKSNPETDTTPIIMLTGEASEEAQMKSFELQVEHFIGKPFNMLILKSAIVQVIKTRQNMLGKITRTNIGYNYENAVIDSADDKLFDRVQKEVAEHLEDSNFSVEQLAQNVGISRVHLNRKMKERFATSPNNYIKTFRMKQAAYLLVNNKVNISEVAYKVGFSSHSYFSSTFHEYFGMTPKEFVAQYSENLDDETLKKLLE